jgi:hypothetical protein
MQQIIRRNDAQSQTKPVTSWEVIDHPPFGNPLNKLRLNVTYPDGKVRMLAPSFKDRAGLDKYVARFHLNFAGKECVKEKEMGICS